MTENLDLQIEKWEKKSRLIVRDDLYEISELREIFDKASRRKLKISLLDTGHLAPEDIELLSTYRFSLYTSDSVRSDFEELSLLHQLLKSKGCRMYYVIEGDLEKDSKLFDNLELFDSIFISSREKDIDLELLTSLAGEISRSRSNLVYYHHQNPDDSLAEICQHNCWIHISSKNLTEEMEILIFDLIKRAKKNKVQVIIHIEDSKPYSFLKRLYSWGAYLIFNLSPVGRSEKIYELIKTCEKKKLPEKAFYLYKEVMA